MAGKNILLHRISYFADVSWPLLGRGYLSIGWSYYVNDETDKYLQARDLKSFQNFVFAQAKSRNRNCLMRFVQLKKGDWVVVPHPYMFSVYEVEEDPISVRHLNVPADFWAGNKRKIVKNALGLLAYDNPSGQVIDLGFMVKVKPILPNISRSQYADAALTARLKVRPTNVWINDLEASVERAIEAAKNNKPINFYEDIIEKMAEDIRKTLYQSLNPDKFERLVKWYFEKIGATEVCIPPRNSPEKQDYEDADIIATFDSLRIIIYAQVKYHRGKTGTWGLEQIEHYSEVHENQEDYSVGKWVISSADFSEQATKLAAEKDIRLIDGKQFVIMLMNAGVSNLDKVKL